MDLKDMILVTENDRGTETNMLMTLDDYKSFIAVDDMSELADNLLQLGRTLGFPTMNIAWPKRKIYTAERRVSVPGRIWTVMDIMVLQM